jgi:hypothetical protein
MNLRSILWPVGAEFSSHGNGIKATIRHTKRTHIAKHMNGKVLVELGVGVGVGVICV